MTPAGAPAASSQRSIAVGARPGGVGDRGLRAHVAQVAPGIHRCVVDADFIVEMRTCRPAALAFETDDIAAFYVRAGLGVESRKVAVPGRNAEAVIDDD